MTALVIANVVLWIAVLALLLGLYALARQVGILYERVAPMGALVIDAGPRVGQPLQPFALQDVRGGAVAVGGQQAAATLLFFLSPTCPICKKLIPVLKSIRASDRGWLRIVLASDGEQPEHLAFLKQAGLGEFEYVLSKELGMHLQIGKLPYGVLLDQQGTLRAKGLVNSREQLESLFTAMDLNVASVQQFLETHA
ncbi:methylamine dehydrogenase accessory protein MauD [Cupriavidus consociatus]|uniref:methylamine dehydrogenase accessory protein MauD n=1 Tax=Cupriavidus consociatus TaxID=2821357 RepID=UPI001AE27DC7|nr:MULTISPECIES: methylamine dehydrogenase accessory protein MauD [unclassified Cupriavidus]MBP0623245.1 methylamine dehydrogenase accessory protein MauD [Cupriavidus sp. LEh25]MDK2659938.1 methylamine dehydrogenase accessory protein MauD [Cupriavidus sp. LEh21]